jgi:hypothetical protein
MKKSIPILVLAAAVGPCQQATPPQAPGLPWAGGPQGGPPPDRVLSTSRATEAQHAVPPGRRTRRRPPRRFSSRSESREGSSAPRLGSRPTL